MGVSCEGEWAGFTGYLGFLSLCPSFSHSGSYQISVSLRYQSLSVVLLTWLPYPIQMPKIQGFCVLLLLLRQDLTMPNWLGTCYAHRVLPSASRVLGLKPLQSVGLQIQVLVLILLRSPISHSSSNTTNQPSLRSACWVP